MAVVNTKSTVVTNADATPQVITNRILTRGPVMATCGVAAVAAADDDTSVFRFTRIPSNARIISIRRTNTAITGGTSYGLGVYQTAANGGAAVSASLFAAAQDLSSAGAQVEQRYTALAVTTMEQRLWELLGLTSDPQRDYDIAMLANTVGTAAGSIGLEITYTI